jgi:hypothetical protein
VSILRTTVINLVTFLDEPNVTVLEAPIPTIVLVAQLVNG